MTPQPPQTPLTLSKGLATHSLHTTVGAAPCGGVVAGVVQFSVVQDTFGETTTASGHINSPLFTRCSGEVPCGFSYFNGPSQQIQVF